MQWIERTIIALLLSASWAMIFWIFRLVHKRLTRIESEIKELKDLIIQKYIISFEKTFSDHEARIKHLENTMERRKNE